MAPNSNSDRCVTYRHEEMEFLLLCCLCRVEYSHASKFLLCNQIFILYVNYVHMILWITDLHTTPFKIFLFIITTNPFQQGLARKDFNQVSLQCDFQKDLFYTHFCSLATLRSLSAQNQDCTRVIYMNGSKRRMQFFDLALCHLSACGTCL